MNFRRKCNKERVRRALKLIYYLHFPGNLPEDGWFQGCTSCRTPTAHIVNWGILRDKVGGECQMRVFLCRRCCSRGNHLTIDSMIIEAAQRYFETAG